MATGSVRTARIRRLPDREAPELDPSQDPFARESIEHLVKRYGSPLFVIDAARIRGQYRRLARAPPPGGLHFAPKPPPPAALQPAPPGGGALFLPPPNG